MNTQLATLGGGCYWCLDAIYRRLNGVVSVTSGYSGGHVDNPTISQVYDGNTGHVEVVQIEYDPSILSYRELLEVFFVMHNPTTLNQQDNDIGEIYRSVIFYHDEEQRKVAEEMMRNFAADLWPDPVVTELKPFDKFWTAGADAQEYYEKHPYQGYCQMIIDPKIQKLRQKFATKLKPEAV